MATVFGRLVRVFWLDSVSVLCCGFLLVFGVFDTFSGNFPRKYNVLGLSAIDSNTSVKSCSRGVIWLIFVKIGEKSVDIYFLLCYN